MQFPNSDICHFTMPCIICSHLYFYKLFPTSTSASDSHNTSPQSINLSTQVNVAKRSPYIPPHPRSCFKYWKTQYLACLIFLDVLKSTTIGPFLSIAPTHFARSCSFHSIAFKVTLLSLQLSSQQMFSSTTHPDTESVGTPTQDTKTTAITSTTLS